MGLRHGLEDGLGLRHGLEAWGREGWLGLRHGGEGWLGLSNGKKRYSVRLEKNNLKKIKKSLISSLRSEMRDFLIFLRLFFPSFINYLSFSHCLAPAIPLPHASSQPSFSSPCLKPMPQAQPILKPMPQAQTSLLPLILLILR